MLQNLNFKKHASISALTAILVACLSLCSGLAQPVSGPKKDFTYLFDNVTPGHLYQGLDLKIKGQRDFTKGRIAKDYYRPKVTAFFCVLEEDLNKSSRIPLKIRLGNLDYVNFLENKNNY